MPTENQATGTSQREFGVQFKPPFLPPRGYKFIALDGPIWLPESTHVFFGWAKLSQPHQTSSTDFVTRTLPHEPTMQIPQEVRNRKRGIAKLTAKGVPFAVLS